MTGGVGFARDSQNLDRKVKQGRLSQVLRVEQWRWHLSWILLILSIITLVVGALIY